MTEKNKHDIILIPTYNERDNIEILIREIFALLPSISILVIDDNSPDGTAEVVRQLTKEFPLLELSNRPKKTGLGEAYKEALRLVVKREEVRHIITMDADGSHRPEAISNLIEKMNAYDLAIGSRYVKGNPAGSVAWNIWRRILSRAGNIYAKILTGAQIHDLTSGFICLKKETVNSMNLENISSTGYAYQIEFKLAAIRQAKARTIEVPITFYPRRSGDSKITLGIIFEGIFAPIKLFFKRIF